MLKRKRSLILGLTAGLITLMATPAFARSISLKDTGVALWIFIIIGALIVLLQLIPAAILFFSFIGTTSSMVFRPKKTISGVSAEEKEEVVLSGYEPAILKK